MAECEGRIALIVTRSHLIQPEAYHPTCRFLSFQILLFQTKIVRWVIPQEEKSAPDSMHVVMSEKSHLPLPLVIEIYDPETECIVDQIDFEISSVHELFDVLGISHMQVHETYELDKTDLEKIVERFNLAINLNADRAVLRYRFDFDDLPYQIHSNRELALMLAGKKPLAVFVGYYHTDLDLEEIPEEKLFDPYVASGRFKKREYVELSTDKSEFKTRRILYARPTEAWRINAYLLLMQTARKVGWNDGFERMEGALLGYEEWQNDAHIESARRK